MNKTHLFNIPLLSFILMGLLGHPDFIRIDKKKSAPISFYNSTEPLSNTETITANLKNIFLETHKNPLTSTNLLRKQKFSVSPNPAKNFINVNTANTSQNIKSTVIDVTGKVVLTSNHNNIKGANKITINTSSLSNGVYLFNFLDEENNAKAIQKVIINR